MFVDNWDTRCNHVQYVRTSQTRVPENTEDTHYNNLSA